MIGEVTADCLQGLASSNTLQRPVTRSNNNGWPAQNNSRARKRSKFGTEISTRDRDCGDATANLFCDDRESLAFYKSRLKTSDDAGMVKHVHDSQLRRHI